MKHKYLIDRINIDWVNQILTILSRELTIQDIVEISKKEGVDFGERRDVFNRLYDLNILLKRREANSTYVVFSPFGVVVQRLFIKSPDKIPYLLHLLHMIKSFEESSPRYFTTYRFVVETVLDEKEASSNQYNTVVKKLEDRFSDDESITGMDKSTILKGVVFIQEVLNETYDLLEFVDPNMFTYGLQQYIKIKTKNEMGSLLVTEKEKQELSTLFLLDKAKVEEMIQKSIRFKKAFTVRYAPTGMVLQAIKTVPLQ